MRRPSGIFSDHLNNPAIDAALAGSTKIPSLDASQLCAAKISSSVTTSIAPFDSSSAARACFQLAGLPIRIADAIVSGLATILSWKIGAAPAGADADVYPVATQINARAARSMSLATATVVSRSLNGPVGFTSSILTETSQPGPTRALNLGEKTSGVFPSPSEITALHVGR